jgi:hypothetical protein
VSADPNRVVSIDPHSANSFLRTSGQGGNRTLTFWASTRRSTFELPDRDDTQESEQRDSNPHPRVWKTRPLPLEHARDPALFRGTGWLRRVESNHLGHRLTGGRSASELRRNEWRRPAVDATTGERVLRGAVTNVQREPSQSRSPPCCARTSGEVRARCRTVKDQGPRMRAWIRRVDSNHHHEGQSLGSFRVGRRRNRTLKT